MAKNDEREESAAAGSEDTVSADLKAGVVAYLDKLNDFYVRYHTVNVYSAGGTSEEKLAIKKEKIIEKELSQWIINVARRCKLSAPYRFSDYLEKVTGSLWGKGEALDAIKADFFKAVTERICYCYDYVFKDLCLDDGLVEAPSHELAAEKDKEGLSSISGLLSVYSTLVHPSTCGEWSDQKWGAAFVDADDFMSDTVRTRTLSVIKDKEASRLLSEIFLNGVHGAYHALKRDAQKAKANKKASPRKGRCNSQYEELLKIGIHSDLANQSANTGPEDKIGTAGSESKTEKMNKNIVSLYEQLKEIRSTNQPFEQKWVEFYKNFVDSILSLMSVNKEHFSECLSKAIVSQLKKNGRELKEDVEREEVISVFSDIFKDQGRFSSSVMSDFEENVKKAALNLVVDIDFVTNLFMNSAINAASVNVAELSDILLWWTEYAHRYLSSLTVDISNECELLENEQAINLYFLHAILLTFSGNPWTTFDLLVEGPALPKEAKLPEGAKLPDEVKFSHKKIALDAGESWFKQHADSNQRVDILCPEDWDRKQKALINCCSQVANKIELPVAISRKINLIVSWLSALNARRERSLNTLCVFFRVITFGVWRLSSDRAAACRSVMNERREYVDNLRERLSKEYFKTKGVRDQPLFKNEKLKLLQYSPFSTARLGIFGAQRQGFETASVKAIQKDFDRVISSAA